MVNTNIIGHAGGLWALVEAGSVPVELDRELNTVRHGYFASPLSRAYTAHPHRDPRTGELHAICYDSLTRNKVRYVVVDSQGSLVRDVAIPVRHGPMIHDCAITARYVLIFDLPITFSFGALLHGATFPYRWNPRHPARVGLLPRTGDLSKLRWLEVEPCQLFHTANAYELEDGSVVVDAVVYQKVFDRSRQGLETSQTRLERWRGISVASLRPSSNCRCVCPWASMGIGFRMPCDALSGIRIIAEHTVSHITNEPPAGAEAPRVLTAVLSDRRNQPARNTLLRWVREQVEAAGFLHASRPKTLADEELERLLTSLDWPLTARMRKFSLTCKWWLTRQALGLLSLTRLGEPFSRE